MCSLVPRRVGNGRCFPRRVSECMNVYMSLLPRARMVDIAATCCSFCLRGWPLTSVQCCGNAGARALRAGRLAAHPNPVVLHEEIAWLRFRPHPVCALYVFSITRHASYRVLYSSRMRVRAGIAYFVDAGTILCCIAWQLRG